MSQSDSPAVVRTRRVHYFEGLDPRGARFYHRLYEEEARKQCSATGGSVETGSLETFADHVRSWKVSGRWNHETVETDYQFMDWEDLMRQNWGNQIGAGACLAYVKYLLLDSWRIARASRYFFYTTLGPLIYLLLLLLVIALASGGAAWGVAIATGSNLPAEFVAAAIGVTLVYLGWRYAKSIRMLWLFRVCTCVLGWSKKPWPKMSERIAAFADHIVREQRRKPVDEVLMVGHSIGAILAIHAAVRILEAQDADTSKFHLMTIGSSIPFLGALPAARAFRKDLAILAEDNRIAWTDFTAVKDILCFFKINPVEASGVRARKQDRPRCFPVRIYRMFTKERYAEVLRDHLRVHLQYLMASEQATEYDYFRITAGPNSLRAYKKDNSKGRPEI